MHHGGECAHPQGPPIYLPTYRHTYQPTDIHTNLPTYIPTYRHTYRHTYIPTDIPTYIPLILMQLRCMSTYLPAYLPTYWTPRNPRAHSPMVHFAWSFADRPPSQLFKPLSAFVALLPRFRLMCLERGFGLFAPVHPLWRRLDPHHGRESRKGLGSHF